MSTLQEIEAAAEKLPLEQKRELLSFLTQRLRQEIKPVSLAGPDLSHDPAIGIWKDRSDLPVDSVEASRALRQKMMRRGDE